MSLCLDCHHNYCKYRHYGLEVTSKRRLSDILWNDLFSLSWVHLMTFLRMNHSTQNNTSLNENKATRRIIFYFCTAKLRLMEYLLLLTYFAQYITILFINLLIVISMAFKPIHSRFNELEALWVYWYVSNTLTALAMVHDVLAYIKLWAGKCWGEIWDASKVFCCQFYFMFTLIHLKYFFFQSRC